MSSLSRESLIETEALPWSDTEVMNVDGNAGLDGEGKMNIKEFIFFFSHAYNFLIIGMLLQI